MRFVEKRAHELYISSSGLSKPADQFGYGYPFLSYSDIFHNYFVPSELKTLVNSNEKDRETCSVERGDVFLTRTSETTEELGMSCVALQTIENATFNGFSKRLRPITDEIVPEYAAYFFRSPYFRAQCMSMASLITRASLNDGMIGRLKIRFPENKKDQIKIAKILMNYDESIICNKKRIQSLEQMAEYLFKEWFIQLRFPGHELEEFGIITPRKWRLSSSPEIKMPKSWHNGKFSELGLFVRGKNITASEMVSGSIPVISAGIDPSGYHNQANVKGKSLTISASGANAGYLKYNLDDIWAADCSYYQNDNYIWFAYNMLHFLQPVISNLQTGAAQPHVHPKQINDMIITIPQKHLIVQFCKATDPIYKEIQVLNKQNDILIRQRDILLPRIIGGKLIEQ